MTTTMTTARAERMHPDWCDLGPECKREDNTDAVGVDNRLHAGRVTAFYPERDDYRIEVRLEHEEEHDPVDECIGAEHSARRSVVLALLSEGALQADGSPFFASVYLSAEDARFLAGQLMRYASQVEHDPVWMPESEFTWKPEAQR